MRAKQLRLEAGRNELFPDSAFSTPSQGSPVTRERKARALLEQLAGAEFDRLKNHARYRLERVNLPTNRAEDLVQDAFLAILTGLGTKRVGRHPCDSDLASNAAFSLYVRGVINSLVEAVRRRREHAASHDPFTPNWCGDDEAVRQLPSTDNVLSDINLREELREFFKKLRSAAPNHLQPLIEEWEPHCLSTDRIPIPTGCRRHRLELRLLSKRLLNKLRRADTLFK